MTWPKILLLAVITAAYTALINQVPFLSGTSFQDIAIYLDCWLLFAVFIIVNCRKWWEASLKCFVFFLVSQPLIYLIEVPFSERGWELFQYYGYWFRVTILTLPGAAIAFQVKRKNWLSVLVLSVATGYPAIAAMTYLTGSQFPYHLLSALFCIALVFFFPFVLLDQRKHRIAVLAITAAVLIVFTAVSHFNFGKNTSELYLGEGEWSCAVENAVVAEVEMIDSNRARIITGDSGSTVAYFEKEDGTLICYRLTVEGDQLSMDLLDELE